MNAQCNDCDRQRIDAFLASDHVALEDPELVALLDSCPACRDYIESQAAEAQRWAQATELLKPSEFDSAGSIACSAATVGHQASVQPLAVKNVLASLTPTDDPNRLGRLGSYEVSGVVGVGGMGIVLKAVDPALDRVVAIKVMAPHLANNGTARTRFSREAKAAAAVLHPNVVPIHSVSSDGEMPYLVMAYIRGGSLQKRLQREGPLKTVEILRIGAQVAAGLAAAHEQGLVHRDIKPENILLEDSVERVTLTDFGLARAVDDASVTREGTIAGTPQYMSPEQARGEAVDQSSDLFSLGSVLYALCTGRPPFRADTSYGVMRRIIDEPTPSIREINPETPQWLEQLIEKLMAKDQSERYASAEEVQELLESCLGHVQRPTQNELPASLIQSNDSKNLFAKSRFGVVAGIVLLAASLLFAIWAWPDGEPADRVRSASVYRLMFQLDERGEKSKLAMDELLRREDEGRLSKGQVDELVEAILERQADHSRAWTTDMGDLIEKRWKSGELKRELWERYTSDFLDAILKIRVRSRIVIGSPAGFLVQLPIQNIRCGSGEHIEYLLRSRNPVTRIGSTIVGRINSSGVRGVAHDNHGEYSTTKCAMGDLWEEIRPGRQTVKYQVELAILEAGGDRPIDGREVFAMRNAILETETTFLPKGQTTVTVNIDPAMKAAVDNAFTVTRLEIEPLSVSHTSKKYHASVNLHIEKRPIDTAFAIVLKDGDKEYEVGSVEAEADKETHFSSGADCLVDLSGKQVDLILRPSPLAAEDSIELFEIWGEDIVFKDVLVK